MGTNGNPTTDRHHMACSRHSQPLSTPAHLTGTPLARKRAQPSRNFRGKPVRSMTSPCSCRGGRCRGAARRQKYRWRVYHVARYEFCLAERASGRCMTAAGAAKSSGSVKRYLLPCIVVLFGMMTASGCASRAGSFRDQASTAATTTLFRL